jgi:uncharacterized RmlC-like cupin family protein
MSGRLKILVILGALVLAAGLALKTGLARQAFFELFALVKRADVLGPTVVRARPVHSPYQRWLTRARNEIPVFEGLVIGDVSGIELEPWPQMGEGINGLYLRFADYQMSDGRILEIPAFGSTASQRHMYEKGIYFIGGPGHTIIQQEGEAPQRVDWNSGSLFAIPLNVRHQHFNDSTEPIRLLAITSFPFVLNAASSEQFINENPFTFTDRYDGGDGYLERSKNIGKNVVETNFVDDILNYETRDLPVRGQGNKFIKWAMAGNSMISLHVSEMPPRMYKKAHRHSSDAFILLLSGQGYSLTWPEGNYHKRHRVDWQAGTLFVPPTYWYHQHLNSGSTPARYLAINVPDLVTNLGLRFSDQLEVDLEEIKDEWKEELDQKQQQNQ